MTKFIVQYVNKCCNFRVLSLEFEVEPGDNILSAAEGIVHNMPNSCGSGYYKITGIYQVEEPVQNWKHFLSLKKKRNDFWDLGCCRMPKNCERG